MKKSESKKDSSTRNPEMPSTGEPTNEEIAALAHSIWEQQGRPEGCDVEHWLTAEAQLRQTIRSVS